MYLTQPLIMLGKVLKEASIQGTSLLISTFLFAGKCMGTLQHPDSQVNAMEISPDGQLLAACGYQHIRMFDVHNTKPNPVVNFEGMQMLT